MLLEEFNKQIWITSSIKNERLITIGNDVTDKTVNVSLYRIQAIAKSLLMVL